MATLTEISVYTRKGVVWIIGAVIAFLLIRFLFLVAVSYYQASHPKKTPSPNVLFDKIQPPKFPKDSLSTTGLIFVLQNIEGRPPETTAAAKVYFMPKKLPSLLAPQKAKDFAAKLGFSQDPQVVTSTFYRFTDPQNNLRTFDLDIVNQNLQLTYDYQKDPSIFSAGQIPTTENAIVEVKSFLSTNNLVDSSILSTTSKATLLKFDGNNLITVRSLGDANAIRVDFYRPDIDGYKLLPPGFNKSYIYVLMSPSPDQKKRFSKISYTLWPIALDNFGTYPLRASSDAWSQLTSGQGIIANMGNNTKDKQIVIRNIYLAYYDSGEAENYLQPVFVFEGDNDFAAYVPAIDPSWFQ